LSRALHARARRVRAEVARRAWEYRQRDHARGAWFALRRVLADAERAYVIGRADALRLIEEGAAPEPVGARLEPGKTILFVTDARLASVADKREVPVRLGPEVLTASCLALVRFPAPAPPPPTSPPPSPPTRAPGARRSLASSMRARAGRPYVAFSAAGSAAGVPPAATSMRMP
jgi:hypothetical protein